MKQTNIQEIEYNKKVAEWLWFAVSREMTTLQRKLFTYTVLNTNIPKGKKKEFNYVKTTKRHLTKTLHFMGSEMKFRQNKIKEIEDIYNSKFSFNPDGNATIELGFFEIIQISDKEILMKLDPSLIPYYESIKELYENYNLQYFIFANDVKGSMLYYYLQKNNMEGLGCSSVKWLKECMLLPDDFFDNGYKFYHRFIVPAVKDINEKSFYHIKDEYDFLGRISGITLTVRKKTKQELLSVQDILEEDDCNKDGKLFFNPMFP